MTVTNGNSQNGHVSSTLADAQELYIGGSYQPATKNATFAVMNPMTGKTLYHCASASVEDYSAAIKHAQDAFGSWKKTSPSKRRLIFLKAADILESYLTQDAPEILSSEVSATESWVKVNILATAAIFRETAGLVTHIKGEIVPADRPGTTILIEREAVGVVFAISPWNAPVGNIDLRRIAQIKGGSADKTVIGQPHCQGYCNSLNLRQYHHP
jgi:benzaldehyde dehydrogenase (NAD)